MVAQSTQGQTGCPTPNVVSGDATRDAVIALRAKGLGPKQIGLALNLRRGQVSGILFRAGLTKPMPGRPKAAPKPKPVAAVADADEVAAVEPAAPSIRRFSWEQPDASAHPPSPGEG